MTNLEKFIKKNTDISGKTFNWSDEAISNQILDLAKALNKDLKLINKPVETTNEQPKIDLDKWFEDLKIGTVYEKPIGEYLGTTLKTKVIQLEGVEVVLFEDGTYNLSDTTGG